MIITCEKCSTNFNLDDSPERADRVMRLLDELEPEDEKTNDK